MVSESVTAHEMAEIIRPVRALLRQNNLIEAIKLVRVRTGYGLKESKDFVDHLQSLPGAKAIKVAELWTNARVGGSISDTPDRKAEPAAARTVEADALKGGGGTDMSLAEWYARYMETHTYGEWEQLLEKCLAAEKTEEHL